MNPFAKTLGLCCGLLLAARGASAADANLPVGPETLLADPAHDPAWRELFVRLAVSKTRQSQFEERRYFSFRKTPVILQGEIRIVPDRGLSLRYLKPEDRIMIVDAQGLLMRDDEGHERVAPADSRARAVTDALVSVLRFDLPSLEKSFSVHGRRDGDAWTLAFVPRSAALADLVGVLAVSGQGFVLEKIELVRTPSQRIEILISHTQEDVIFSGDVLDRFFR